MKSKILIGLALFALALAIRLRDLSDISFWFDELWTASLWAAPNSLAEVWGRLWMTVEGNLPLYPIFINLWTAIFGTNEFVIILPSILAGAATVTILYVLGEKVYSRPVGIIAALLMATLSTPLYYSQEARCYSLVLLLVCLNLLYRYSSKNVGWIITSVLLCWIHYFGIFFVFIQFLPDLFKNRDSLKRYLIPLLSLVPITKLMLFQIANGPIFKHKDSFPGFLDWIFYSHSEMLMIVLAGFFILQSILILISKNKLKDISGELLIYVYGPYFFLFAFNVLVKPIYSERYFITMIPPALLLVADLIWKTKYLAPVILSISLWSSFKIDIRQNDDHPRYEKALAYINDNRHISNILCVPSYHLGLLNYYLKDFKEIQVETSNDGIEKYWHINVGAYKEQRPTALQIPSFYTVKNIDIGTARAYLIEKINEK